LCIGIGCSFTFTIALCDLLFDPITLFRYLLPGAPFIGIAALRAVQAGQLETGLPGWLPGWPGSYWQLALAVHVRLHLGITLLFCCSIELPDPTHHYTTTSPRCCDCSVMQFVVGV